MTYTNPWLLESFRLHIGTNKYVLASACKNTKEQMTYFGVHMFYTVMQMQGLVCKRHTSRKQRLHDPNWKLNACWISRQKSENMHTFCRLWNQRKPDLRRLWGMSSWSTRLPRLAAFDACDDWNPCNHEECIVLCVKADS